MDSVKVNNNRWAGHFAILVATILWGAMSPIAKGVLQEGILGGVALSAVRIAGGALLFVLAALLPHSLTGDTRVEPRDLWPIFIASVLMISLNQGLFIIGIEYTTPIDTSVMCTLTPVFTLIFAALFINMPMTPVKILGVAVGLGGALVMAFTDTSSDIARNPLLGDTLCMLAQICAAVYYVFFLRIIDRYPPFTVMKWMFVFSALTYVPCTLPWLADVNWVNIGLQSWWSLAYIILLPTFVAYLIIPFSQKRLKPTVISMYAYFQPVVAAALAAGMGLAVFGWMRISATLMIFMGVFLVSFATSRH